MPRTEQSPFLSLLRYIQYMQFVTKQEHRTPLSFGRHGTGFVRFLRIPGIGNGLWFVPVQKLTESRHGTNQSLFPIIIGFLRGPAYPRQRRSESSGHATRSVQDGGNGDRVCICCRLLRHYQHLPRRKHSLSTLRPNPGGGAGLRAGRGACGPPGSAARWGREREVPKERNQPSTREGWKGKTKADTTV